MLLWDFFMRVMQGVTMAFFEDVWSRNFLNIFATPLIDRRSTSAAWCCPASRPAWSAWSVMLLLATAVFGLSFFAYGAVLVPFLLVLFLFGIALGIFGSGLVLRLGPASEWFIWPIPALLSPFAGVFYPLSTLPAWMQVVSHVLPPSYVFEGMRRSWRAAPRGAAAAASGSASRCCTSCWRAGSSAACTATRAHRPDRPLQRGELGLKPAMA